MSLSRTGLNWTIVAVFCGLLLLVCLVPKESLNDDLRELLAGKDKILHALAYGVLAVLACRALVGRGRVALAHVVVGMLFATGYGALLEVMQGALSDRTSSMVDAGANAIGAGSGGLLWFAAALRSSGSRDDTGDYRS